MAHMHYPNVAGSGPGPAALKSLVLPRKRGLCLALYLVVSM